MSKYILGGGISGLIWKFYNPEFEVVTPQLLRPGSTLKAADPFIRSKMIWLHDTPQTRQFLIDLGWKDPDKFAKKSRIGYFSQGVIKDTLNPEHKNQLVRKKMVEWDKWALEVPEEIVTTDSVKLSLTSGDDMTNFMNVLDVDHGEILYRLNQRCKTTNGYVGSIKDSLIGFTDEVGKREPDFVYKKYDEIVSTIPASAFWTAWDVGHETNPIGINRINQFRSLPITFVTMKNRPVEFEGDYEMIYYDRSLPFTRISHIDNKYCIEFTGNMPREVFEKMFPELASGISDYWQLPAGRIRSQLSLPPAENIIFSGRFAQWQHQITTEHVIQDAMNYAKKKNGQDSVATQQPGPVVGVEHGVLTPNPDDKASGNSGEDESGTPF